MNVLLADSDRDLLQCYKKLLAMESHDVTTAFDGAQVFSLLKRKEFDIAIVEELLPRMEAGPLLQALRAERIPVIMLTSGSVNVKTLLLPEQPGAYLSFPFLPEDLTELIRNIMEKSRSGEILSCGGVDVDVSGFCFAGTGTRLTGGEIDLIRELRKPIRTAGKRTRVMIRALNEKLERLGKSARIIYEMGKGYTLVN